MEIKSLPLFIERQTPLKVGAFNIHISFNTLILSLRGSMAVTAEASAAVHDVLQPPRRAGREPSGGLLPFSPIMATRRVTTLLAAMLVLVLIATTVDEYGGSGGGASWSCRAFTLTADGSVRFTKLGATGSITQCALECGKPVNAVHNVRGTTVYILNAAEHSAAFTEVAGANVNGGAWDNPTYGETDNVWRWFAIEHLGPIFTSTATGVGTCHQGYCLWDAGHPSHNDPTDGTSCMIMSVSGPNLLWYSTSCAIPFNCLCRHDELASQSATSSTYYLMKKTALSWSDARDACHQLNYKGQRGHLATVETADDHATLIAITRGAPVWVGGTNAASYSSSKATWKWATGPLRASFYSNGACVGGKYCNWAAGSPSSTSERCQQLDVVNTYSDDSCFIPKYYVCEFDIYTAASTSPAVRVLKGFPTNLLDATGLQALCSSQTLNAPDNYGWALTINSDNERRAAWEIGKEMPLNFEYLWTGHYEATGLTGASRDWQWYYGPAAETGTFFTGWSGAPTCVPTKFCCWRPGEPNTGNAERCGLYSVTQASFQDFPCSGSGTMPAGCEFRGDTSTTSVNRRKKMQLVTTTASWYNANQGCRGTLVQGVPGNLADISDEEAAAQVGLMIGYAALTTGVWVGGSSHGTLIGAAASTWRWLGATSRTVFHASSSGGCSTPPCAWSSTPSLSAACLSVEYPTRLWSSAAPCTNTLPYVCEWNLDVAISGSKAYVAYPSQVTWSAAFQACRAQHRYWNQRGKLAHFTTNTEYTALSSILTTDVWIGAKWTSATTYSFVAPYEADRSFFASGACVAGFYCPTWTAGPSGTGCVTSTSAGMLTEGSCAVANRYVCEFEANVALAKSDNSQHTVRYKLIIGAPVTWDGAVSACALLTYLGRRGALARVSSSDEFSSALHMTGSSSSFWLGGSDAADEGIWRWSSGAGGATDAAFQNGSSCQQSMCPWSAGAPAVDASKNCLSLTASGLQDTVCSTAQAYLCSWTAPSATMTFTTTAKMTLSTSRTRPTPSPDVTLTKSITLTASRIVAATSSLLSRASLSMTRSDSSSISISATSDCSTRELNATVFLPLEYARCCALSVQAAEANAAAALSALGGSLPSQIQSQTSSRLFFFSNATQPQTVCYVKRNECLNAAASGVVDTTTFNGSSFALQRRMGALAFPNCGAVALCFRTFMRCMFATFAPALSSSAISAASNCRWHHGLQTVLLNDRASLQYGSPNTSVPTFFESECITALDKVALATACQDVLSATLSLQLQLCRDPTFSAGLNQLMALAVKSAANSAMSTLEMSPVDPDLGQTTTQQFVTPLRVDPYFDLHFGTSIATCGLCLHAALSSGKCGCDSKTYVTQNIQIAHAAAAATLRSSGGAAASPTVSGVGCFTQPFTLTFCRARSIGNASTATPFFLTASALTAKIPQKAAATPSRRWLPLQTSASSAPTGFDNPCPGYGDERYFQLFVDVSLQQQHSFAAEWVYFCMPNDRAIFLRSSESGACDEPLSIISTSSSSTTPTSSTTTVQNNGASNSASNISFATTATNVKNTTAVVATTAFNWCTPCASTSVPRSWAVTFINRTTSLPAPGIMTYCAPVAKTSPSDTLVGTTVASSIATMFVDGGGGASALQAVSIMTTVSCRNARRVRAARSYSAATPLALGSSASAYWLGTVVLMLGPATLHFLAFAMLGVKNKLQAMAARDVAERVTSAEPSSMGAAGANQHPNLDRPWIRAMVAIKFPNPSLFVFGFFFQGMSFEAFALAALWHLTDNDPSLEPFLKVGFWDKAAAVAGVTLATVHCVVFVAAAIYARRFISASTVCHAARQYAAPKETGESDLSVNPGDAREKPESPISALPSEHHGDDASGVAGGIRFLSYDASREHRFTSPLWTVVLASGFWHADSTFVASFGPVVSAFGDEHFVWTTGAVLLRSLLVSCVSSLSLVVTGDVCALLFLMLAIAFFIIAVATLVTRPYRFLFSTFANVFLSTCAGVVALKVARPELKIDVTILVTVVTWGSVACAVISLTLMVLDRVLFQPDALGRLVAPPPRSPQTVARAAGVHQNLSTTPPATELPSSHPSDNDVVRPLPPAMQKELRDDTEERPIVAPAPSDQQRPPAPPPARADVGSDPSARRRDLPSDGEEEILW